MECIRVGIIEDDNVIRTSLEKSVAMYPNMTLAGSAMSVEEGLELFGGYGFDGVDVILLDVGLPGMSGLQGIGPLKHKLPDVDIIMLTTYDEADKIFMALSSGACSYISKKTSLKVIMEAITTVYRGGSYMSPSIARKVTEYFRPKGTLSSKLTGKQYEIVERLAQGKSYKMIAADLDVSLDTIRTHIKRIYKTLHINSKIELINIYNNQ